MIKDFRFKLVLFFSLLFLFSPVFAASLEPPTLIYPTSADSPVYAGEIEFRWTDPGANFYKYHIDLPSGEAKEETIISSSKRISDLELGNYSWAVCSCNDVGGEDCGIWSKREGFAIVSAPPEFLGGLVPCGRKYDDPQTPDINESEPCSFKHIFLLFKNILDFLLWRLGLIVLGLLVLATGVIFYFSLGAPATMARVKSLLKSAIVGYGIIFLAWLIINWVLIILGYRIGIFGKWWQVIF